MFGFHIHQATERYQARGMREDSFAVGTDRYDDLRGALFCLAEDVNLDGPLRRQGRWF